MDLGAVDRITADAIGEPGLRTFYMQARAGEELLTVIVEKEQVELLARSVLELLADLSDRDRDGRDRRRRADPRRTGGSPLAGRAPLDRVRPGRGPVPARDRRVHARARRGGRPRALRRGARLDPAVGQPRADAGVVPARRRPWWSAAGLDASSAATRWIRRAMCVRPRTDIEHARPDAVPTPSRTGELDVLGALPNSSNAALLVRCTGDAEPRIAVYKPMRGEAPCGTSRGHAASPRGGRVRPGRGTRLAAHPPDRASRRTVRSRLGAAVRAASIPASTSSRWRSTRRRLPPRRAVRPRGEQRRSQGRALPARRRRRGVDDRPRRVLRRRAQAPHGDLVVHRRADPRPTPSPTSRVCSAIAGDGAPLELARCSTPRRSRRCASGSSACSRRALPGTRARREAVPVAADLTFTTSSPRRRAPDRSSDAASARSATTAGRTTAARRLARDRDPSATPRPTRPCARPPVSCDRYFAGTPAAAPHPVDPRPPTPFARSVCEVVRRFPTGSSGPTATWPRRGRPAPRGRRHRASPCPIELCAVPPDRAGRTGVRHVRRAPRSPDVPPAARTSI